MFVDPAHMITKAIRGIKVKLLSLHSCWFDSTVGFDLQNWFCQNFGQFWGLHVHFMGIEAKLTVPYEYSGLPKKALLPVKKWKEKLVSHLKSSWIITK